MAATSKRYPIRFKYNGDIYEQRQKYREYVETKILPEHPNIDYEEALFVMNETFTGFELVGSELIPY